MQGHLGHAISQDQEGTKRLLDLFRWANLVLVDGDQILLDWEELEAEAAMPGPDQVLVRFRLLDGTALELTATSAAMAHYEGQTDVYTQCSEGEAIRLRFYRLHAAGTTGTEGKGRLAFEQESGRATT